MNTHRTIGFFIWSTTRQTFCKSWTKG